jgi:hypothetical protein
VLGLCLYLGLAVPVRGETNASPARPGGLSLGGRFSGEVQEFFVDMRAPIVSSARQLLMLNPRGCFLEDREQELNLGLVYRRMMADEQVILGANVFYDGRWTMSDNYFGQVGAGIEALTRHVDLRANYYYPVNDAEVIGTTRDTAIEETRESGRTVGMEVISTYTEFEEALEGMDVEAGLWIPCLSDHLPTAVFVGYYYFMPDHLDDIDGARVRLECRPHSRLTLDAEWYEDEQLNGTDYFVGFKLHAPFAFWDKSSWTRSAAERGDLAGRMTEMVVRDFRIRTVLTGPVLTGQEKRVLYTSSERDESPAEAPPSEPPTVEPPTVEPPAAEPPESEPPEDDSPQYDDDGNIIF